MVGLCFGSWSNHPFYWRQSLADVSFKSWTCIFFRKSDRIREFSDLWLLLLVCLAGWVQRIWLYLLSLFWWQGSIWWTLRLTSIKKFGRDGDLWGMEIPLVYNSIAECIGIVFFGHVCFHPFHCVLRFTLCLCFANFTPENNLFGTFSVFWFDLENDIFQVKSLLLATAIVTITKRELCKQLLHVDFSKDRRLHASKTPITSRNHGRGVARGDEFLFASGSMPMTSFSRSISWAGVFNGDLSMLCRKHHLCAFERFWNLWNLDVPIYALMPVCPQNTVSVDISCFHPPLAYLFHIGQHCGCRIWTTPGI